MINQIADVKAKTEQLPNISEGLMQVRRIQAHLKEQIADGLLPKNRWQPWSSLRTPLPCGRIDQVDLRASYQTKV
jgi:hypothetical protein